MGKYKFDSTFPSNLENAKLTAASSLRFIQESLPHLHSDDIGDLKLILCELLFNAVIHGNNEDINKKVTISIMIDHDEISAMISDEGTGFDYNKILSKITKDDPISLFDENGRGIRLVLSLADNVTFNQSGSQIIFFKRVNCYG